MVKGFVLGIRVPNGWVKEVVIKQDDEMKAAIRIDDMAQAGNGAWGEDGWFEGKMWLICVVSGDGTKTV